MLLHGEYKRGVGWTYHSDSAFCEINLVLVLRLVVFELGAGTGRTDRPTDGQDR